MYFKKISPQTPTTTNLILEIFNIIIQYFKGKYHIIFPQMSNQLTSINIFDTLTKAFHVNMNLIFSAT